VAEKADPAKEQSRYEYEYAQIFLFNQVYVSATPMSINRTSGQTRQLGEFYLDADFHYA